jgi:pseudouridine-5'-phosphate glycosidase
VAEAIAQHRPVVALETSIVGQGLPAPHNLRAARGCEAAIREEGAIPATVAVADGRLRVGLDDADLERVAAGAMKVSSRDLGPALAKGALGATTVAATMRAAAMAGIRFMATGGIGGVHRGHAEDLSGAEVTPRLLARMAELSGGRSLDLNVDLVINNARVAAQVARAFSELV